MDGALDARKAAAWSALAGIAHVATVLFGYVGYPYLYDALIAIGHGLMLPLIAVLHVRHAPLRQSGAVLGTIAGTATVVVGLAGAVNVELRPAALLVLGMWWWTIGKTWAETAVMPRPLGAATALLGAIAIAGAMVSSFAGVPSVYVQGFPQLDVWPASHVVLGAWLVAVSAALCSRSAAVPSR